MTRTARALAAVAIAIGLLVLVGWWFDAPALTSIVRGYVTMKPNTALGLVLGGAALWLLAPAAPVAGDGWRRGAGVVLAASVAAIGLVTLVEYAEYAGRTFDEFLARVDVGGATAGSTATPGRMAVTTAAAFLMLGAGLAALDARSVRWSRIGEWLLAAGVSVPLAVIVGYLYRVIPTHGSGQGVQMALHTAAGALALGAGAFVARPEREFMRALRSRGAGGQFARRLLPAALGVPIALGALRLIGEQAGVIDAAGASALVTAGTMFLLAGLVWRTAAGIDRTDSARLTADQERSWAETARAAAEASNAAKTQFLAVMSHELRTPLNAIAGYTELIEVGVYGAVTEAQLDALARIRRSGQHLLGLVNQVLALAQSEAGHEQMLEIGAVPVDDVLLPLEVLIAPQCRARGLVCDFAVAGPGVVLRADRRRVEQIVINLLSNAIKFTEAGGRITIRATAAADAVLIRVIDTGRGIAVDQREAVFAPFVQAEAGLTRRVDGAGLGLAIGRDLARAMGGDVTIERSDGDGSTFLLTLPAAMADDDATLAARSIQERTGVASGSTRAVGG